VHREEYTREGVHYPGTMVGIHQGVHYPHPSHTSGCTLPASLPYLRVYTGSCSHTSGYTRAPAPIPQGVHYPPCAYPRVYITYHVHTLGWCMYPGIPQGGVCTPVYLRVVSIPVLYLRVVVSPCYTSGLMPDMGLSACLSPLPVSLLVNTFRTHLSVSFTLLGSPAQSGVPARLHSSEWSSVRREQHCSTLRLMTERELRQGLYPRVLTNMGITVFYSLFRE